MPIFDKDGKFIERVYKDGERLRRVYENSYLKDEDQIVDKGDEGLVYSLYDVNYNYGQDFRNEPSGAELKEDSIDIEVWGKTNELGEYSYLLRDNEDTESGDTITSIVWSTGISDDHHKSLQKGFPIANEIDRTEKENYKDYNLYASIYRTNFQRRKTNYPASSGYGESRLPDESTQLSENDFYEQEGMKITGSVQTYDNVPLLEEE